MLAKGLLALQHVTQGVGRGLKLAEIFICMSPQLSFPRLKTC